MASGNSWQLYQELGNTPAFVFQALDHLSPPINRYRQRRMTEQCPKNQKVKVTISPSTSCVGYANSAYRNSLGAKDDVEDTVESLRRTYSHPRITAIGNSPRINVDHRRSSFRERGRKLLARAKTFLDVTVLSNVLAAITPPPSPRTWSTSSSTKMDEDDDDFTTASDLSGLRLGGWDDECADESYQQIIQLDGNYQGSHSSRKTSESQDAFMELPCPPRSFSFRNRLDPRCPVHGENSILQKRVSIASRSMSRDPNRQFSLISRQSSFRTAALEFERSAAPSPPLVSSPSKPNMGTVGGSNFMLKLARRRHKAALNSVDRHRVERERSKILRNLFTLSVAFLFLISAFQGLQNLQTTIHGENGLGAISLSVVYSGLVVSCLFTPPYLLNRIGCKLTLILSMSTFSIYMLTHFMPKWYSLLPGSLLVGFGAAPLWAAKCSYLSEAGFRYAELNLESSNVVIVRFFGIFFMIVHMGQVFGNLISSWILRTALGVVDTEPVDRVDETCGHFFTDIAHSSSTAKANLARPSASAIYSLYAVYFCCTIVAALIIAMFLNQLRRDIRMQREKPHFELDLWHATVQHLRKPGQGQNRSDYSRKSLLLMPLTIFNGMQQAFIAGEFTKAYLGCCLGVTNIGYVMMSFGMFDAVCSLVFGPLIKLFGRMPLLMFGAVVDMLMIFTLLVWPPNPADTAIFYVVAACWGMADGVWSTQINGLWVVIFADNLAAAFANYRLWESVGFIISFAYTPFLDTETKLYILLAMLWVGMLGYGLIELWEPLEDYALGVKQKLQSRPLPKRKQSKKSKSGKQNIEAKQKLLSLEKTRPKLAPLASEETDL